MGAKYRLVGDEDDDLWCEAEEAAGLFTPLEGGLRRVELIGCVPRGKLRNRSSHLGNAYLSFLDDSGEVIGGYRVTDVRAGADLTVTFVCYQLVPEVGEIWDLVCRGLLNRKGLWKPLDPAGRFAWRVVALNRQCHSHTADKPAGAVYEMDGAQVVDEDSFYCALGEAVNGPGGFIGWGLDGLTDCLRGDWGATPPFTLVWHDSAAGRSGSFFDAVMEVLRDGEVEVILR